MMVQVRQEEVERVGTATWLAMAGRLLCFRPEGGVHGQKATADDLFACMLPDQHESNCVYGNSSQLEAIVARHAGVRP